MAIACLIFLVVVIIVPVTMKYQRLASEKTPAPTAIPSMMPSISPTHMPTTEKFTRVVEKLLPLSGDALIEPGSPQNMAARWISDEDPMQMDFKDPNFEQRYAMAVLYYSFNYDNSFDNNWLSGESECNWKFVEGPDRDCLSGCIEGKVCSLKIGKFVTLY